MAKADSGKRLGQSYVKNLAVSESDVGESLLIFESANENVHVLNITGKIIWNSFNSPDTTVDDIIAQLSTWFGTQIDKGAATQAVTGFLRVLREAGLLVPPSKGGFPV